MHIRTNTVNSNGRSYTYTQIVQSKRDERGKPGHVVLASFRDLPEVLVANLKTAIAAARDGKAVVLAEETRKLLAGRRVCANLSYLDVAVAYAMWQEWGLSQMLAPMLDGAGQETPPAEVVAALAVHRCIAPGSKLAAERWYPTTALAEIQGYAPKQFNNSRVHRVLGMLEKAEGALQESLPLRVQAHAGAFVSLFLDITDTWFEGRGPALAEEARTKEGVVKRKIGIALMCNGQGLPVRWKTLSGRYHEANVMEDMVSQVSKLGWVGDTPVVVDRAMGRIGSVEFLAQSGVRFVTALTVDEYHCYTDLIPWKPLLDITLAETDAAQDKDLERIGKVAAEAGLKKISPRRYVLDLGIVERQIDGDAEHRKKRQPPQISRIKHAMALALQIDAERRSGVGMAEVAEHLSCSVGTVKVHRRLARLAPDLRQRVMDGEIDGVALGELLRVALLAAGEQHAAFESLRQRSEDRVPVHPCRNWRAPTDPPAPLRLRGVVTFNPEQMLRQRRGAEEKRREFEAFIDDINRRLRLPSSRRTREAVLAEVGSELRHTKLRSVYETELTTGEDKQAEKAHLQVCLRFNQETWAERRRYDGFCFLVAHEDLPGSADDIVRTYFAKDKVEKDFQTIKSELELRPLHHRSDPKVKAHVTLCVLALLLERTLEHKLAAAGRKATASTAFELLRTCHLNQTNERWGSAYTITTTTPEQRTLLKAINLEKLDDDAAVAERLTPR